MNLPQLLILFLLAAAPRSSVPPVESKPHPCKVPAVSGEVLCATYPVWEDRERKSGRKIGLNIVILPALQPNHAPDPIFFSTADLGPPPRNSRARNREHIPGRSARPRPARRLSRVGPRCYSPRPAHFGEDGCSRAVDIRRARLGHSSSFRGARRRATPNSLHIVFPEASHGNWGACGNRIMAQFIVRGSKDGLDVSCVANQSPTKFAVETP